MTDSIDARIQRTLDDLVRREIVQCCSSLMWDLAQSREFGDREELLNLLRGFDYESALDDHALILTSDDGTRWALPEGSRCWVAMVSFPGCLPETAERFANEGSAAEWLVDHLGYCADGGALPEGFDIEKFAADGFGHGPDGLVYEIAETDFDGFSDQDIADCFDNAINLDEETTAAACEALGIEPYSADPLEHWIVSSWFAGKLAERGEIVGELFDFRIWGRCTSGQGIAQDGVIRRIAEDMEILPGQRNEWNGEAGE